MTTLLKNSVIVVAASSVLLASACRAKGGGGDAPNDAANDVDIYDASPGDGGDGDGDGGDGDGGDGGDGDLGLPACPSDGSAHSPDWVLDPSDGAVSVGVSYGGGCEEHVFELCWPDGAFMESEPVGARLELWHSGEPDFCEAWIEEERVIDVSPMADAWRAAYGDGPGELVLHIGEYSVTYRF